MRGMRGITIVWGAVAASILLVMAFFVLDSARAAVQIQPEAQRNAVNASVRWLMLAHQNEDGGFSAFSAGAGQAPSDVAGTADAILALASTGHNVAVPYADHEQSAIGFLESNVEDVAAYAAQGGGTAGKLILALTSAPRDPRDFGGYDFTISLTQHLSPTGQYNVVSPYEQSLAILAQSVVSDAVPSAAVEWLLAAQSGEGEFSGSWDDGFGTMGNIDATAMAIMALVAAGEDPAGEPLSSARAFLIANQRESGGWGYAPDLPESANSTALAVQAVSAIGEDIYSADSEWAQDGVSPLAALAAWQSDTGAFQADFGEGAADDFFTTVQALPALVGRPYPLPSRYEGARQAVDCLTTMQDAESAGWPEFAGMEANAGGTARAIRAMDAHGADISAETWTTGGSGPLDALRALAPAYVAEGRGGRAGVLMRGMVAAGGDVTDFGGLNLPVSMTNYLSPTGEYDHTAFGPFSHAEAMLGLISAGEEVDPSAVEWLVSAQADDGGWGSPDATGISLHAVAELNGDTHTEVMQAATDNLRATQQADGGWGFAFPSSVNSTSEVVQGLVAAGENPFDPSWSVVTSGTLRNGADVALAQQGANGCWPNLFGEGDDPYATTDGIILLSQEPPWGTVVEGEAAAEPEPTTEPEATVAPTETVEGELEATEAVPSPTAPPTAEAELAQATAEADAIQATATTEVELVATPTAAPEIDDTDEGIASVWFWIVAAAALLLFVILYFRYTRRA